MNVIRLVINWSRVEPERGVYNYNYIDSIKMAIEDIGKYGMYVLIDMHQDAYGKYIVTPPTETCASPSKGWDGAPEWATITDGVTTCLQRTDKRESGTAVVHAFHNLWFNTDGIGDNFVKMWMEVVKHTCKYENVMGYDLINEPGLGHFPLNQEIAKYSELMRKVIVGIREAEKAAGGYEHIAVFENTITWNGEEVPFTPLAGFTNDKNILFSAHSYFSDPPASPISIEQAADLFHGLCKVYKTGFLLGEWLGYDSFYLNRYAAKEDQYFWSSTFWQWASPPGDPHGIRYDGTLTSNTGIMLIEVDQYARFTGVYNEPALKVISRPYPRAINGKPLKLRSNPDTGEMLLEAKAEKEGTTVLWINNRFGEPKISCTNGKVDKITNVTGGYIAYVITNDTYSIQVSY